MKIKVDSIIHISEPTQKIKQYCKDFLTLKNPEIQKKKAMGFYTGNLKSTIYLYTKKGNDILIPIGCLNDIWKINPNINDYIVDFGNPQKINYPKINLKPYDYQEKAITNMIKAKRGILKANCRFR